MATARTWAIKGVSDQTRDAVHEAARAAGLTVGAWVDKALAQAAEEALHPRPPAASRADVAEVVRGLLREELAPLAAKVEQLATLQARNDPASPVKEVRTRLRRRRGGAGSRAARRGVYRSQRSGSGRYRQFCNGPRPPRRPGAAETRG